MCGCLSCAPYWGPGLQPRHVPDWESNQQPFDLQAGAQPTEQHQPGPELLLIDIHYYIQSLQQLKEASITLL